MNDRICLDDSFTFEGVPHTRLCAFCSRRVHTCWRYSKTLFCSSACLFRSFLASQWRFTMSISRIAAPSNTLSMTLSTKPVSAIY